MLVRFYLSIGLSGCQQEEVVEIEDSEFEGMGELEKEDHIESAMRDWAFNYIDMNWGVVE